MAELAEALRKTGRDMDGAAKPSADFRDRLVQYLPHLRAVARSLTGHRDRADDLVNDTVLKALSAESQFVSGTNLKAWLMTILRNH